jgi:hypothetical protein
MVKKGTVISLSVNSDEPEEYIVTERLNDIGHGEGGWLCVEMEAFFQKGANNVTPFDCWRITDRYLETQLQRGVIKIIDSKYEK